MPATIDDPAILDEMQEALRGAGYAVGRARAERTGRRRVSEAAGAGNRETRVTASRAARRSGRTSGTSS